MKTNGHTSFQLTLGDFRGRKYRTHAERFIARGGLDLAHRVLQESGLDRGKWVIHFEEPYIRSSGTTPPFSVVGAGPQGVVVKLKPGDNSTACKISLCPGLGAPTIDDSIQALKEYTAATMGGRRPARPAKIADTATDEDPADLEPETPPPPAPPPSAIEINDNNIGLAVLAAQDARPTWETLSPQAYRERLKNLLPQDHPFSEWLRVLRIAVERNYLVEHSSGVYSLTHEGHSLVGDYPAPATPPTNPAPPPPSTNPPPPAETSPTPPPKPSAPPTPPQKPQLHAAASMIGITRLTEAVRVAAEISSINVERDRLVKELDAAHRLVQDLTVRLGTLDDKIAAALEALDINAAQNALDELARKKRKSN